MEYTCSTFTREGEGKYKGRFRAFVWDVCDTLPDPKCGQKLDKNCTSNAFCSFLSIFGPIRPADERTNYRY
jgi:hypothetical protein